MSSDQPTYYYLQTDPPNDRKKFVSRYDANVAIYQKARISALRARGRER